MSASSRKTSVRINELICKKNWEISRQGKDRRSAVRTLLGQPTLQAGVARSSVGCSASDPASCPCTRWEAAGNGQRTCVSTNSQRRLRLSSGF